MNSPLQPSLLISAIYNMSGMMVYCHSYVTQIPFSPESLSLVEVTEEQDSLIKHLCSLS